jgi:hypothetical protein
MRRDVRRLAVFEDVVVMALLREEGAKVLQD